MICRLRAHLKVIDEKKRIKPRPNKKAGVISNKLFMVCPLFLIFFTYPAKYAFINTQISFNRSKRDEFQSTQKKGTIESFNTDAL